MDEYSPAMIARAKKGICPVCGKQKNKHTRKMLRNCKITFANRFSTRTATITLPNGKEIKINPLKDVHIRRAKKEMNN